MIQSIWHTANQTQIQQEDSPQSLENKIKVQSFFSMISLGTERLVMNQSVPESMQNQMRVPYMQGSFNLPIKYGYALAGVVEDGAKVHLMHPHQNQCWVKEESLFTACQSLPLNRIPLISNVETVINAIWDSHVQKNQKILVCGFGNIGSLLASTLKNYYQLKVSILEANAWRREKAKALGFELYKDQSGFDVAFNTTANAKALQLCINQAHEEAKIVELSWYGTQSIDLQLGSNFHLNRLRIIGSQVSKIPVHKRDTFDYEKRKQLAVEILQNDCFDDLITHQIPFQDAPRFFQKIRENNQPDGLIYLIKYRELCTP